MATKNLGTSKSGKKILPLNKGYSYDPNDYGNAQIKNLNNQPVTQSVKVNADGTYTVGVGGEQNTMSRASYEAMNNLRGGGGGLVSEFAATQERIKQISKDIAAGITPERKLLGQQIFNPQPAQQVPMGQQAVQQATTQPEPTGSNEFGFNWTKPITAKIGTAIKNTPVIGDMAKYVENNPVAAATAGTGLGVSAVENIASAVSAKLAARQIATSVLTNRVGATTAATNLFTRHSAKLLLTAGGTVGFMKLQTSTASAILTESLGTMDDINDSLEKGEISYQKAIELYAEQEQNIQAARNSVKWITNNSVLDFISGGKDTLIKFQNAENIAIPSKIVARDMALQNAMASYGL